MAHPGLNRVKVENIYGQQLCVALLLVCLTQESACRWDIMVVLQTLTFILHYTLCVKYKSVDILTKCPRLFVSRKIFIFFVRSPCTFEFLT